MKQWKALTVGVLFAMNTIFLLVGNQIILMLVSAALAALFLGKWYYRYQADKEIVEQARLERQNATQVTPTTPPMMNEASRRLVLPPPLHNK